MSPIVRISDDFPLLVNVMAAAGGLKETFPFPVASVLVLPLVTCPVTALLADPALTVFVYAATRDEAPSGDEVVAAVSPPRRQRPPAEIYAPTRQKKRVSNADISIFAGQFRLRLACQHEIAARSARATFGATQQSAGA